MKATETYLILCQMVAGEITLKEAHELILRLFNVMIYTEQDVEKAVSNLVSKNQAPIVRHYDGI